MSAQPPPLRDILILGAGPAGLSAALALTQAPPSSTSASDAPLPFHVTVLELRPEYPFGSDSAPASGAPDLGVPPSTSASAPPSTSAPDPPPPSPPSKLPPPLGSSVYLTPLALRYLDHLGRVFSSPSSPSPSGVDNGSGSGSVGTTVRSRGIAVRSGIQLLSLRTGGSLGRLWAGADAVRVRRADLVGALREKAAQRAAETQEAPEGRPRLQVRYGAEVVEIHEETDGGDKGKVVVKLVSGEVLRADVLLGCDGLHSAARRLYVDPPAAGVVPSSSPSSASAPPPPRVPVYSGKAAAYGFVTLSNADGDDATGSSGDAGVFLADGMTPAVEDSSLATGTRGSLIVTFCEPSRRVVNLGAVLSVAEPRVDESSSSTAAGSVAYATSKEGWRARGADQAGVRADVVGRFRGGRLAGLEQLLDRCDGWILFPVYKLPPGGRWSRGRVLLLGDAAHAMPPQGESTGVALEDGVLVARVLERWRDRSVDRLFRDYEDVRRPVIDRLYKETTFRWDRAAVAQGTLQLVVMEWVTRAYVAVMNWKGGNYFASDVRNIQLPE